MLEWSKYLQQCVSKTNWESNQIFHFWDCENQTNISWKISLIQGQKYEKWCECYGAVSLIFNLRKHFQQYFVYVQHKIKKINLWGDILLMRGKKIWNDDMEFQSDKLTDVQMTNNI